MKSTFLKIYPIIITLLLLTGVFFAPGCRDKLNLKPESKIVIPESVEDLEKILDNTNIVNFTPGLLQISADEYFIPELDLWQSLPTSTSRNAPIWSKDIYAGEAAIVDWRAIYSTVFYANNVIDLIETRDISNDPDRKRIKGWALFTRAYAFYALVSTFSKAYEATSAASDLGIPLKLTAGIDEIAMRSSVKESYDQIIKDVLASSDLLQQDIIPGKRNRPSKVAAFALLARVYLSMRNYEQAEMYASRSLAIYSTLTSFQTLNKTSQIPFTFDAEEVIYFSRILNEYNELILARPTNTYGISPDLINLYDPSDLRLKIYFQKNTLNNYNIKPINTANAFPFTGLATDEMYLIKAECLSRRGEKSEAMELLNKLLKTRWDPDGTAYQDVLASSQEASLDEILKERRRALVFRSVRWTDLKRLNLEGRNIKITRKIEGQIYELMPNSPLYVLPIPDDEITLSGIQQNLR